VGGQPKAALPLDHANEFLSLAQSQPNSWVLATDYSLVGRVLITIGDYAAATSHVEHAVASYRAGEHRPFDPRLGADIGVTAAPAWALALWHRGYSDQARSSLGTMTALMTGFETLASLRARTTETKLSIGSLTAGPGWLELLPVGRDHGHRQGRDLLDGNAAQLARGRIDPVQIVEYHQYRMPLRERRELAQKRDAAVDICFCPWRYSTVTLFARLRGWSTSVPLMPATW
jgi:hypothetical protein